MHGLWTTSFTPIHSPVNLNSSIGLSSEFQFYNQPPVSLLYLYFQKYYKIKMKV